MYARKVDGRMISVTEDRIMKILKRVESGEISPDAAVELIEALGSLDDSDGGAKLSTS